MKSPESWKLRVAKERERWFYRVLVMAFRWLDGPEPSVLSQSVQSLWYQKATWAHPSWLFLAHSLLKPQLQLTVYAYWTLWAVECTVRGASRSFSVTVFKLYPTWLPAHESSGFPLTLMTLNEPLQVPILYNFL